MTLRYWAVTDRCLSELASWKLLNSIADAVVEKLRSQKTSEQWLEEGNRYCQSHW